MRIQCPACGNLVEVADDSTGRVVNCPSCAAPMQVPEAPAPAAAGAATAPPGPVPVEPTRQCPLCGETVLKVARKCKHCKADIPDEVDVEAVRARLAAKEQKLVAELAAGGPPPVPFSVGGRLRIKTMVGAAILLAGSLLAGLLIAFGRGDGAMMAVLPIIIAVLALIGTVAGLVNDVQTPSAAARTTPVDGLKAFLHAVRLGRFKYAYACLLSADKDRTSRQRRAFGSVKVSSGRYAFADLAGFKAYWKDIARSSFGYSRRMVVSAFALEREEGDWALASARVKLEAYPAAVWAGVLLGVPGILLALVLATALTKREEFTVVKLLRRVGEQWCVVNGELDSAEDRCGLGAGEMEPARPVR